MAGSRIDPIEQDIALLIRQDLSPEAQSAVLAAYARETLAEVQAANEAVLGHVSPHHTYVDGREGASEDRVRPAGIIVYEFDLMLELFVWIDDQLRQHSPVGSGRDKHPGLYKSSHLFFADDQPAEPLSPPAGAQQFVFVNDQPYARKIEAAEGVYEAVAAMAQRRFGNIAKIAFGWRSLKGGAVGEWAGRDSAKRHAAAHRRQSDAGEWLTRQPSIVITVR